MKVDEARLLITKMVVVWPKANLEPTTVALWQENLLKVDDPVLAGEAVAALMEVSPFWPHWSEFMREYRSALAVERRDSQVVRAVGAGRSSVSVARAGLRACREALAEAAP